jgi:hypothetical protein
MVDALRRALAVTAPGGLIVDLHPTPEPARLAILDGSTLIPVADRIDSGGPEGPAQRHAAADRAIARCVADGSLRCDGRVEFPFWTQADSTAELRAYIDAKWKQLHFRDADFAQADALLRVATARRVVVTEHVTASRLAG